MGNDKIVDYYQEVADKMQLSRAEVETRLLPYMWCADPATVTDVDFLITLVNTSIFLDKE